MMAVDRPTGTTKYSPFWWDRNGKCAIDKDRLVMAALSLLPAPVPLVTEVSSSTPHDSAEIATETNGRRVKI